MGDIVIRPMTAGDIDAVFNGFAAQVWHKPREILERYWSGQSGGTFKAFMAEYQGSVAGYLVLYPAAAHGPFEGTLPEISDFNVFIKYQRRGVGNQLLDEAERAAAETSDAVSLGVGLHSGYGPAQRIYMKRGYIPDGSGVWYQNRQLEQYADCRNDDDLILYLSKKLP